MRQFPIRTPWHFTVFRLTDLGEGLLERFGERRVGDTPLVELLVCGAAVGMAEQGLKPVCEIQFTGFIYPALDPLASHVSRLRAHTRARMTCPRVLRTPAAGAWPTVRRRISRASGSTERGGGASPVRGFPGAVHAFDTGEDSR